jgi:hypothetical protein
VFDFTALSARLIDLGPTWNEAASALIVALALGLGVAVELLRPR